jgi:NAD-dependent deacetylase
VEAAQPNVGHRALADLEGRVADFLLLTQNVDGLHREAGSRHVFELHGNIRQARGTKTGRVLPRREAEADPETGLPSMPDTGELLRPNVVWFGEMLPRAPFEALSAFLRNGAVDVCLVIGTTALLPYIGESARLAQRTGALVVEINPEPGEVAALADVVWPTTAGYALPLLLAAEGEG